MLASLALTAALALGACSNKVDDAVTTGYGTGSTPSIANKSTTPGKGNAGATGTMSGATGTGGTMDTTTGTPGTSTMGTTSK